MEIEKSPMPFSYDGREIRFYKDENEKIWTYATDYCSGFGLKNVPQVVASIDQKHKMTISNTYSHSGTRGGAQSYTLIDEAAMYQIALRSRKPEAEKFVEWVTDEVIPSIRRTGAYMVPSVAAQAAVDPQVAVVLAQTLLDKAMQSEAVARVNEMSNTMRHLQAENADLRWRLMRAEPEAEANMRRKQNIGIGMTRSWQRRKGILPAEDKKRTRHGSIQILP